MTLYNSDINLNDEIEIINAPFFGFDSNAQTLFIKSIPRDCARREIEELFEEMEGYICLSVSEPLRSQNLVRFGWVIFKNSECCEKALDTMNRELVVEYDLDIVKN